MICKMICETISKTIQNNIGKTIQNNICETTKRRHRSDSVMRKQSISRILFVIVASVFLCMTLVGCGSNNIDSSFTNDGDSAALTADAGQLEGNEKQGFLSAAEVVNGKSNDYSKYEKNSDIPIADSKENGNSSNKESTADNQGSLNADDKKTSGLANQSDHANPNEKSSDDNSKLNDSKSDGSQSNASWSNDSQSNGSQTDASGTGSDQGSKTDGSGQKTSEDKTNNATNQSNDQQDNTGNDSSQNSNTQLTCTLLVECHTILNHMDNLTAGKEGLVPSGGVIYGRREVTFSAGETVFDVLMREMQNNRIQMEYSYTPAFGSNYIEGINNLYEFDCGELSGWMYCVNGSYPNYGCSQYTLANGDSIEFHYTCDLGRDL